MTQITKRINKLEVKQLINKIKTMKSSFLVKCLMAGASLATKAVIYFVKGAVVSSIAVMGFSVLADALIIHGKRN